MALCEFGQVIGREAKRADCLILPVANAARADDIQEYGYGSDRAADFLRIRQEFHEARDR